VGNTIAVAMSGWVDSSVAAALLERAGRDVVGMFMRTGVPPDADTRSARGDSLSTAVAQPVSAEESARRVSAHLGIPFCVVDVSTEFERVLEYFCAEYAAGRTPNPCVACNAWIKFACLADRAAARGAERFATGHYARTEERGGRMLLLAARQRGKDQSYMLSRLSQEQLRRTEFPLGELSKDDVRRKARELELPSAARRESQDACFIQGRSYHKLLARRVPGALAPGDIVDTARCVVGRHEGVALFTVGQRRGLGVAFGEPRYVVALVPARRQVVVGTEDELVATGMNVSDINWIAWDRPPERIECLVKVRYAHEGVSAVVRTGPDRTARVEFAAGVRAVAPGQAAVFYDDEIVLGGGWIDP